MIFLTSKNNIPQTQKNSSQRAARSLLQMRRLMPYEHWRAFASSSEERRIGNLIKLDKTWINKVTDHISANEKKKKKKRKQQEGAILKARQKRSRAHCTYSRYSVDLLSTLDQICWIIWTRVCLIEPIRPLTDPSIHLEPVITGSLKITCCFEPIYWLKLSL